MKKVLCSAVMFAVSLAVGGFAQQTGWLSSYWDGCKPTCSWPQNLDAEKSIYGLSSSCFEDDSEIPLGEIGSAGCAKDPGGVAFTCWNQIPFVDENNPNLAYGFGATSAAACGQCFEITFTGAYEHGAAMPMHSALAGKKVVIMGRNTGTDVAPNQIDFMIPGGGLGQFDCFTRQIGLPTNSPILGKGFGGLLGNCIDLAIPQFGGNWDAPGVLEWVQDCHRQGCQTAFGDFPTLLEGCMFHVDFMMSAPNPIAEVRVLNECPPKLVETYKPQSSKYTLIKRSIEFTNLQGNGSVNMSNRSMSGIDNTTVLTYDVNVQIAGQYTMDFYIATQEATTITVTINGQPVGALSNATTASWGVFEKKTLDNIVTLSEGSNTVVLSFQTNSVNFEQFMFTGDDEVRSQAGVGKDDDDDDDPITSIRQPVSRANAATPRVTVRSVANGFTAALPANHGYTSYSVTDMRGRVIRRGIISAGVTDLRISGVKSGMVFLRLEGAGRTPSILRMAIR